MRTYFLSPYLSNLTRSTCVNNFFSTQASNRPPYRSATPVAFTSTPIGRRSMSPSPARGQITTPSKILYTTRNCPLNINDNKEFVLNIAGSNVEQYQREDHESKLECYVGGLRTINNKQQTGYQLNRLKFNLFCVVYQSSPIYNLVIPRRKFGLTN